VQLSDQPETPPTTRRAAIRPMAHKRASSTKEGENCEEEENRDQEKRFAKREANRPKP
jgi:hypothetical protein